MDLEGAEPYIDDLITARLDEFKEQQDAAANKNYQRLEKEINFSVQTSQSILDSQIKKIEKHLTERINAQDEIIDLISGEISKDSKKKSDIILEIRQTK